MAATRDWTAAQTKNKFYNGRNRSRAPKYLVYLLDVDRKIHEYPFVSIY